MITFEEYIKFHKVILVHNRLYKSESEENKYFLDSSKINVLKSNNEINENRKDMVVELGEEEDNNNLDNNNISVNF